MSSKRPPGPLRDTDHFEALVGRFSPVDPETMRTYVVLRRTMGRIERAMETHLARHDFSIGRFLVLVHLCKAEGHTLAPAELSERCGVTRATITGLLDSLEAAKHIVREADPDDGRSFVVRLTITGRRALEKLLPDHFKRVSQMMGVLSPTQLKQLQSMMTLIFGSSDALEQP